MYDLLKGLRIVEGASFIAAPSCGLHLLQLGAEVIRFDAIGGGPDFHRWPRASAGASFYWEGLNKGKKSVALDLSRPQGRELAVRLATAPGENAGIFLTNYPADGFLSHARLAALRPDMITVRVMGWPDGATAVDYTVNSAIGLPLMTGPTSVPDDQPVNHVLPAWDLLTGATAAYALLAAERHRRATGLGQELRIPLSDVALATLGHLGQIAEVATGADRPRMGNDLYGAFGRDFATADRKRVMVVAITPRQWSGLLKALAIEADVAAVERELGVSFARDEGVRFVHRERLLPLVERAVAARTFAEVSQLFDRHDVCWGPYRTVKQAIEAGDRFSPTTPLFAAVDQPSGHRYLTPGSAVSLTGSERPPPPRAPRLGEHTDEVLAQVLGLPEHEIARLHDEGLVA
jgi:2-methylfumaryl-CoA isomerase